MPFKRRRFYGKRRFKRRFGLRRFHRRSIKSLAKRVKRIERNTEVKWFDTYLSGITVTGPSDWYVTPLNLPVNGTTASQRIGSKITMKSLNYFIQFRGWVVDNAQPYTNFRWGIFREIETDNATPAIGQYLDGTVVGSLWLAPRNRVHLKQYKVYKDKKARVINPQVSAKSSAVSNTVYEPKGNVFWTVKGRLKLNSNVLFNGSAGTVADLERNGLFFFALADAADAMTIHKAAFRLNYTDA